MTTGTGKPKVSITVTPATVEIAAPELMLRFLTEWRSRFKMFRKLAPAARAAEKQEWQDFFKAHLASSQWWHQQATEATAALVSGDSAPFLHLVDAIGPRALGLLLTDPRALDIVEGWWLDHALTIESQGRANITQLSTRLRRGVRGNVAHYTPAETAQRKTENNWQVGQRRRQKAAK